MELRKHRGEPQSSLEGFLEEVMTSRVVRRNTDKEDDGSPRSDGRWKKGVFLQRSLP